ncbi:MAG TPA: VCBS repeat-containing protein, partial [Acidobacteriota bacterium]|nr:VCBS repeat-containing protein [Acidobacteriota bacterium]
MRLKGLPGFAYLSACFLLTFLSVLNPTRVQAQNQYSQNKEVISDASSSFVGIADGDIDLDGLPDVAICDRGLDQVVLLLNTSSGLRSRVDISLKDFMSQLDDQSGGPTSIDMGDIDQDGDLDIVVSIDGDLDQILVLTNLGGGFGPESFVIRAYPVGGDPTCIKLADLTGPKDLATGETLPRDGAPEIVMLNRRTGTVATLINSGYGTFGQGRVSESGGINPVSQALGDFNDDGEIDTAVLNRGLDTTQREDSRVCILLGNGDGSFQPTNPLLLAPSRAVSIAAAGYGVVHRGVEIDIPDINRDGVT